jgi:hypothetical protein
MNPFSQQFERGRNRSPSPAQNRNRIGHLSHIGIDHLPQGEATCVSIVDLLMDTLLGNAQCHLDHLFVMRANKKATLHGNVQDQLPTMEVLNNGSSEGMDTARESLLPRAETTRSGRSVSRPVWMADYVD